MWATTVLRVLVGVSVVGGVGATVLDMQRSEEGPAGRPAAVPTSRVVWTENVTPTIEGPMRKPAACAAAPAAEPRTVGLPAAASAVALTVTVPARSVLHLDDAGRVVSASTNTGCAPRETDELWSRWPDGSSAPATADVLDGVSWLALSSDGASYLARPDAWLPQS